MAESGESLKKSIESMQKLHASTGIMKSMNLEILGSLYKLQNSSGNNTSEITKDLESIARKLKAMALSNGTKINLVSNYLQEVHNTQKEKETKVNQLLRENSSIKKEKKDLEEKIKQLEKQLAETKEELEDSILASQDISNDTKDRREEVETSIHDEDDSDSPLAKKTKMN